METTTFWLAVLAIAVAVQSLIWVGIGAGAFMAYRELTRVMTRVQHEAVEPLVAHAHTTLEKVEDATARIRAVDDKVRDVMAQTGQKASRLMSTARFAFWPVVGIGQSAIAAAQAFQHPRRSRLPAPNTASLVVARDVRPRMP
ncbi:MAG: hypothetical protein IT184_06390 [Acidobacteria bacterium]|nr:hypothetical protein [Acidobacteriota bacterium]